MCAHGSRVWMPRRCRRCAGCLAAKRNKAILRIARGATLDPHAAMLTLTSRPGQTWEGLMREWCHMVRFLRKRSPDLEYAASKEEGSATGMKHLHVVLVNFRYTHNATISAEWKRLTGAHIIRIERLRSESAFAYVAKYVSKSMLATRKNITYSRGWPKLEELDRPALHIGEPLEYGPSLVKQFTDAGAIVVHITPGCECWGHVRPAAEGDHWWLKSLMDHSLRPSQAG